MSSGLNEGNDGRGSDGSGNGVSLLSHVDSSVPSSPHLDRGEHSTLSALITEGTLARSVGS